ncbi:polysaccharide lyase family 14 protein [Phanerochaete carnosa HHB-10118-sp]|uniref:Polysaccharide lyase family 14 protein n=1 Tax=Phanerochaete carnosa (strain HHB-10118-sp) TaxID=650164 RepID=K5W693_PHACS|nr:polysaccharide lyase family 14 protein [Phanerochaete carnosa HHB-10118-sp]EKM54469.1 polysaccharide lyase family 14 protein [Phanerochaete carnosa HHB-10118-sp]
MLSLGAVSLCAFLVQSGFAAAQLVSASDLASQYSLTTSTSIPFPTATLSNNDAQSFIVDGWSLSKGRIQNGASDVAFVQDPFPNNPVPGSSGSSGPVLEVTYPEGSFSHDTGGAQLYSLWNTTDGSTFNSMLVTYEVAFDAGFNWVMGGKLPGLRGGLDPDGCSGGTAANGSNCFSSRLMWRKSGEGEVYAYIIENNALCSDSNVLCNQDGFGTSIDRGSYSFAAGQWNLVTMLVRLNDPLDGSNGQVVLYYNNVQAVDQQGLQLRTNDDIDIGGLYFSTFFGGNDSSWATPMTTHTYFRNIQLWGSSAASNLTGSTNAAASLSIGQATRWLLTVLSGVVATLLGGII